MASAGNDKWEFQTILLADAMADGTPRAFDVDERMAQLGREGWELVSVVPIRTGKATSGQHEKQFAEYYRLFFKRRMPSEP